MSASAPLPSPAARAGSHGSASWAVRGTAIAAAAVPPLVTYSAPPVSTFYNQCSALLLWGLFAFAALRGAPPAASARAAARATWPLLAVLAVLALAALASSAFGSLPRSLAAAAVGALGAAAVMLLAGAAAASRPQVLRALLAGLLVAGLASSAVALTQVFAPGWTGGDWIAASRFPGRAAGNLRQPNHLATLLLWSLVALVPLAASPRWPRAAVLAAAALLVLALELTGSRTGILGLAMLALWGLADRRLGGFARALLLAAPLGYAAVWAGSWWLAQQGAAAVGTLARMDQAELSSWRFAIWSNALSLIAAQPWGGVGFGRFNLAWTLTPFANRPPEYFDHTHNLVLQFAAELGVPLAAVLLALLLLGLGQAMRRSLCGDVRRHAVLMLVLLAGAHSLLEYPLWYLHFLLPAAFAFGASLRPADAESLAATSRRSAGGGPLAWAALASAAAALVVAADYRRVSAIFAPAAGAEALARRIADGARSAWFAHHADYAAATTGEPSASSLPAARRAAHHLLDARLLIAWSRALAAAGQVDAARHVAQRLREFGTPAAETFFAPCDAAAPTPQPFQCEPPARPLPWRHFVR